ncbi:hypothetical protein [Conexibacter sp. SYSU D00693]|uniref:hypothetical protein n=1 Tax=Conexibacter sp. SYSU D00693 TaxID=2812560 RepID=UPI00196B0443|nr:hypothetical protein [Conexibacter sp. SYSU D00693]
MQISSSLSARRLAAVLCGLAALVPATASAKGVTKASDCPTQVLTQHFLSEGDANWYTPVPGGVFSVASGATYDSGALCIGAEHPTFRFRANGTGGTLEVHARYRDEDGEQQDLVVANLSAATAWLLSDMLDTQVDDIAGAAGARTYVTFRFVATGGDWQVDDLYVDPFVNR